MGRREHRSAHAGPPPRRGADVAVHGDVGRGRRGPSVAVGHGEVEVPADGVAAVALEELAHTFRLAGGGGGDI